jgi:tetratricopeptide (TPR) repeat protein/predicted Ser/Thr protein kinase
MASQHSPQHDDPAGAGRGEGLESLVGRFERLWIAGERPDLEAFLGGAPAAAPREVLIELVHTELELRLKAGEPARVEEYFQRFPGLAADAAAARELIAAEFHHRARREPGLNLQEFPRRFPQWGEELDHLLSQLATVRRPGAGPIPAARTPSSSAPPAAPAGWPNLPGYEVVGELGRGGMGVVYQARQTGLGRLVALKMIRDARRAGVEEMARFQTEAQALARLQHPHIVQIHEVGTHDGLPYFALEYVEGGSLDRKLNGAPVAPQQAARLVQTLALAMDAAHRAGVVHRDLKPANVLVGDDWVLKVTDFGLAKRLDDDSGRTRTGAILGTPSYMAPEQASGNVKAIGPATDVYALGAILYELLTGRPPFKGASVLDTLEQVRTQLPVAPTLLTGKVPRDLETICLKCLHKDPRQRYVSARALAEDVARFLDGKTILARPAGSVEKTWRWCRRRPAQAALAAALLVLVLGGGATAFWYQGEQARQREEGIRREAEQEARRREERARLERNAEALSDLLNRYETAVREEDAELATAAQVQVDRRLTEEGGEKLRARADRCKAALALLGKLDEIDNIRWTPAADALPKPADLAPLWRAALADYGVVAGQGSGREAAARVTASVMRDRLLMVLDLWLKARPTVWVREVLRSADPEPYREAVRDAVAAGDADRLAELARRPEALAQPPRFAVALGQIGAVPRERRRAVLEVALRERPGDLKLLMEMVSTYGLDREKAAERVRWMQAAIAAHPRSVAAYTNLGIALFDGKDVEGAIAAIRIAIRLDPELPSSHLNHGFVLFGKKDMEGAIAAYREAIRLKPRYAQAYCNLGNALREMGDLDGAVAAYREAIHVDPNFATAHNNLGLALYARKDVEGAVAAYREAIRLDPEDAPAHHNLGNALLARKELGAALAAHTEACRLAPTSAQSHYGLGNALLTRKDLKGAEAAYREAIRLDPKHARAYSNLGNALLTGKDPVRAVAAFREAIRLDPNFAIAHNNLGNALNELKDVDGAVAAYREAVRLDPKHAIMHQNLGIALYARKDVEGAAVAFREAARLNPSNAIAQNNLGNALLDLKDLEGAAAAFREAIRLEPNLAQAHGALGQILLQSGQFAEAREATLQALKLLSPKHPLRGVVQQTLQRCDQFLALEGQLTTFLNDSQAPGQPDELLQLIQLCHAYKDYHATAARLAALAFTVQPALADDPKQNHRSLAARSAALAAAGKGCDPGKLTAADRTALRAQALAWLQADLRQWANHFQARDPQALAGLLTALPDWQREAAFAPFRDPGDLAQLAPDEQKAWAKLWAEVGQLVKEVAGNVHTERFTGVLTAQDRERVHEVKLHAGRTYVLDLESKQFDAYLKAQDAQGKTLGENDDIVPGVNLNARLIFTAPADGTYRLVATSFEERGRGAYTLTVRAFVEPKK